MKHLTIFFYSLILIFSFEIKAYSQCGSESELYFYNYTSYGVKLSCYPISMVMNGDNQYNLLAQNKLLTTEQEIFDYNNLTYIQNGILKTEHIMPPYIDELNSYFGFNYDYLAGSAFYMNKGSFGPGVYKIVFDDFGDSLIIENDGGGSLDFLIFYHGPHDIWFQACLYGAVPVKINYNSIQGYHKNSWNPHPEILGFWSRNKNLGNYVYDGGDPSINQINPYNIIPLDSRVDCNQNNVTGHISQNHIFPHWMSILIDKAIEERHGTLTLNLNIKKNVNTPLTFYTYPDPNYPYNLNHIVPAIRITEMATLKICQGTNNNPRTFTMNQYKDKDDNYINFGAHIEVDPYSNLTFEAASSNSTNARLIMNNYCMTTILPQGRLFMYDYSNIVLNAGSTLTLENNSKYLGGPNSMIIVNELGQFCNKGATIVGKLTVLYQNGNHYIPCDQDYTINDSTKMILSEGAILEIPDNKTLSFQGPETILQMDSSSTIKFGANSKIVFQNGARIKANYAKFTSATSNSNWAGIYLNDLSKDTLKNCTIENAVNGISIKNKNNSFNETNEDVVSTEISNCSFVNTTSNTTLVNAVYAYNSSDILFKGNNVYSNQQPNAFSIGVFLEYCSPSNVNIIGNTIYNTLNGINSIQSSPYVASNTITGQTGSYYGIFLDNSNATVEYNSFNNFNYSIDAIYSSPNILNNTFNNATTSNLNLRKNSIFILNPVISGSTSYMYGGMNTFNGNPSSSVIQFSDESYPSLDKGCNVVNTSSSDYLLGELPSALNGTLYATDNFWSSNFNSSYFNVTSGLVEYEPLFDGVNYPTFDGYNLSSIGFGLSDTLYYDDLGDLTSSDLFMQAKLSENRGLYSQAILKYKEIVSTFRESDYAVISISRIFDCLQKMNTPVSKYSENNIYLNSLKTNNEYPLIIREIAEDFIIKGKAKLGNVTEAINDYQNIYSQNQNNNKGFHALLNKTCLEQSIEDTSGDGPNKIFRSSDEHKLAILNLLKLNKQNNNQNTQTNNNLPLEYKLGNNYPNPFNPTTKINFSIPKSGFVSLKIYDITGREVKTLVNETKQAGYYTVDFNGSLLSSGVYFYRIQSGDFLCVRRMVLIK